MTTLHLLPRDRPVVWVMSEPVPLYPPAAPRAVAARADGTAGPALDVLRSALAAIPNADATIGYDEWFRLVCGVHEGSGGSDEGLALADEWSARSPKHSPDFLATRVWPYIKPREGGITARTVLAAARAHGWSDPSEADAFAVVVPASGTATHAGFECDKAGFALASLGNLALALRRPAACGARIAFDEFAHSMMYATPGADDWRPLDDGYAVALRIHLEARTQTPRFRPIGTDLMRAALLDVERTERFDSAQTWLAGLPAHDGTPRVEAFLPRYFGTADTPYTRAVSRYIWTALAGRVIDPGCKVDMVPVLIGKQNAGKSTSVAAMVPHHDYFVGITLATRDDDLARTLRGKLIAELGELRGLRAKEREDIKAWITRQYEEWIPKYRESKTKFPRRLLLIGTSNNREFLDDETGNRRWLPIDVAPAVDVPGIERDRDQLWAEGRDLFGLFGVEWQDAVQLAPAEQEAFEVHDSWVEILHNWLACAGIDGSMPRDRKFLRIAEVGTEAFGLNPQNLRRGEEMRIGRVLRACDYRRCKVWADGCAFWAFVPAGSPLGCVVGPHLPLPETR